MVPAFDLELRQGMGQRGADHRGFLIIEFFGQAGFGPTARFFSFCLVDVFRFDRHVCEHSDTLAGDFHKPVTDRKKFVTTIVTRRDFTRGNLGHERNVVRVNAEFTFRAGQRHYLDILRVDYALGRHNLQFQRTGHVVVIVIVILLSGSVISDRDQDYQLRQPSLISSMPPFM